jgi:hypothetical protein
MRRNSIRRSERVKRSPKVKIITDFEEDEVKHHEYRPLEKDERKTFRYNCPICWRFFNTMLSLKCCENYICIHCIVEHVKSKLSNVKSKRRREKPGALIVRQMENSSSMMLT